MKKYTLYFILLIIFFNYRISYLMQEENDQNNIMHEEHLKNKVIFDLTKLSRILQMRHKKLSDINWNRIKPFDLLSLNEKDFHNCIVSKDDEKRSYKKEEIIELFGAIKKTKEYKDSRSLELVLGNANINGGKKDRFNDVNFVNRGKIGWLMGDGFVNAGGQMLYNASNMFNQIESVSAGFERAAYEIPRHIDEIKNTASVTSRTIEQLLKVVNAILQKIGHIFNSDRESDKVIVKQKKIMIPMSIISAIIIVIFLKQLLHYFLFSIDLEKNNTEITAGCIKEIQFINPTECVIHHTLNDLLNKPCYKQIKRKVIDGLRKLHQSYLFDDLISRKNFLIMLCACLNPFLIYFSYEILYFFQYCLLSLIYFEEKIFNYNNTGSSIEEPVLGNKHTEVDKNLLENRFELSSVVDDSKFQPRQQIPISGIDNCEDEKLSEVAERPKRYSGGGKKLPHAFRYCVYTIPGLFILVILCRNDIWQGINHTAKYILESYLVIFFKERLKDLKGKLSIIISNKKFFIATIFIGSSLIFRLLLSLFKKSSYDYNKQYFLADKLERRVSLSQFISRRMDATMELAKEQLRRKENESLIMPASEVKKMPEEKNFFELYYELFYLKFYFLYEGIIFNSDLEFEMLLLKLWIRVNEKNLENIQHGNDIELRDFMREFIIAGKEKEGNQNFEYLNNDLIDLTKRSFSKYDKLQTEYRKIIIINRLIKSLIAAFGYNEYSNTIEVLLKNYVKYIFIRKKDYFEKYKHMQKERDQKIQVLRENIIEELVSEWDNLNLGYYISFNDMIQE